MKVNKSHTEQLKDAWEDLGFHGYISPDWRKEYVVPIKIIIDECNGYKHYGHPLCVFVPNGYDDNVDEDEFYALTVEDSPVLIHYPDNPRVAVSDIYYVKRFIKENVDLLKKISDWGNIEELRKTRYYKHNNELNMDNQYNNLKCSILKEIIHKTEVLPGQDLCYGTRLLIYSGITARYNVCEYGSVEPLYLDKSGKPILFDMIYSFETDENEIIFAQAIKDNVLYKLYDIITC